MNVNGNIGYFYYKREVLCFLMNKYNVMTLEDYEIRLSDTTPLNLYTLLFTRCNKGNWKRVGENEGG